MINIQQNALSTLKKNLLPTSKRFIDKNRSLQKEEGDVKVFLCVPFEKKDKPPKIDIVLSDIELKMKV